MVTHRTGIHHLEGICRAQAGAERHHAQVYTLADVIHEGQLDTGQEGTCIPLCGPRAAHITLDQGSHIGIDPPTDKQGSLTRDNQFTIVGIASVSQLLAVRGLIANIGEQGRV